MCNLRTIAQAFQSYGELSGQIVNWSASFIYFSSLISDSHQMALLDVIMMNKAILPFVYLGVPLFKGTPKVCYLQGIEDKILHQFESWKGKSLSMAGRVCLVNSVITSMFIHSFIICK